MIFAQALGAKQILVSGNIEAHQMVLSVTQVQAPIVYLPFDEGAYVSCGTVLARVDDRLYRQQTAIDQTDLQVAVDQVKANESKLMAAQQSLASDQFDRDEKKRDYARAEMLLRSHVMSQQAHDLALTAEEQANATLAHGQAVAETARRNIVLSQANEDAVREKLKLDEITAKNAQLRATGEEVRAEVRAMVEEVACGIEELLVAGDGHVARSPNMRAKLEHLRNNGRSRRS